MREKLVKFLNVVSQVFVDGAGKVSSKRLLGVVSGGVGLWMAVTAGLHWYDIDPTIIQTVLTFSGAMLGISVFSKDA